MINKIASMVIAFIIILSSGLSGETWKELVLESISLADRYEYDSAIAVAYQALQVAEEEFGESDTITAKVHYYLGRHYSEKADYRNSEKHLRRALAINQENLPPAHRLIASCLSALGLVYTNLGNFDLAESAHIAALKIKKEVLGTEHIDYANSLETLAELYEIQDKYKLAKSQRSHAVEIKERLLGNEDSDLAMSLNGLGNIYRIQGDLGKADSLFNRALNIQQKVLDENDPEVAYTLNSLANIQSEKGRFRDAIKLYTRSSQILEQALGQHHTVLATVMSNLAICHHNLGDYYNAEPLYKKALIIAENKFGTNNPKLIFHLNGLANLYMRTERYDEAETYFKQALEIAQANFGNNHFDVALSCTNLGFLYFRQKKYELAKPLFENALSISESSKGADPSDIVNCQENLARLYARQRNYNEADSLFACAISGYQNIFGNDYHEVGKLLQYRAEMYTDLMKLTEAESLYAEALEILKKSLTPSHHFVGDCLIWYSRLHRLNKNFDAALKMAWEAYKNCRRNYLQNYMVLPENDALAYFHYLQASSNNFLSCYFDSPSAGKLFCNNAAEMVFSCKGQVSDCILERQKSLISEKDSTALLLADSLKTLKYRLSRLFVDGPKEDDIVFQKKSDSLQMIANLLEGRLARLSISFRKHQEDQNIDVRRLRRLLPENTILVEYIMYNYLHSKSDSLIPRYLAIVLSSENDPIIINLGNACTIDSLIAGYRGHMLNIAKNRLIASESDLFEYRSICDGLYALIWKPLEKFIEGNRQVFIAPDGALNILSFAGLMDERGTYFIEKFTLHYLSSGRDLIRLEEKGDAGSGLFALGDPNFNAGVLERLNKFSMVQSTGNQGNRNLLRGVFARAGDVKNITMSSLTGTRQEIESIIESWNKYSTEPVFAYLGSKASEDNFKADAPGSRVIHLATHGYFLEKKFQPDRHGYNFEMEFDRIIENPLLRSGLFLAGGNLHGAGADSAGIEDGILTAYEVSAMDFSGAELVVLSACETGLGAIQGSEGVYGLRRAFQMGGARTVISALWPVSDKWTTDLMSGLYNLREETLCDQMRRIQLDMIRGLREEGVSDHPFSWAGFIVLGEWR